MLNIAIFCAAPVGAIRQETARIVSMRPVGRLRTVLLASCLVLTGAYRSAAAAEGTWLPDFDAKKHLYVENRLAGRLNLTPQFEKKVEEKGLSNDLSVYVVMTEAGAELGSNRDMWAPELLHNRLWDKWLSSGKGFSEDRSVVILYVRSKGAAAGSTAVRAGRYVHSLGIDRESFSSFSGPVMPAVRKYMRTDPETGVLTILENINGEVVRRTRCASDPSPAVAKLPHETYPVNSIAFLFWGGLILVLIGVVSNIVSQRTMVSAGRSRRRGTSGLISDGSSCSSGLGSGCSSDSGSSCSSASSCGSSCGGGGGD
ncbi:MAG: hypothetical protein K2W95_23645 [Candidatus Obscuribacterales bacterium]|nr:hypothetical protein [Candidatus Obscuribacterales bacterium]